MNVLITGAAGGLGRALASECARRGFDLFLTDRYAPSLEAIKAGIVRRFGVNVCTYACDLTHPDEVTAMLDCAASCGALPDMLLNVAGVDFEGGFTQRSAKQISTIVELNIEATLNITHMALERRERDKKFYIVFVSSLASLYPMPLKACYAASKRFLYDFAYALGSELRGEGVSVTALCPAGLATTDEAMSGIAAQGFWGNATTSPLETVARKTITKTLRGQRVYIPGTLNRALGAAGKLLPRAAIASVIHARWSSARSARGVS